MELQDKVVVNERTHPFYMFTGTVVGKRGFRAPGDPMLLILINERQRSFLIPESMLRLQSENQPTSNMS